jgi:trehalose 6-phosphate phosphatase
VVARILDNLDALQKLLKRKPFGLITDMDGTLSEIPHNFLETTAPPPTLPQLAALVNRFEVLAVVSGRKTEAVKDIVNIEGVKYIGHYGMERWENNRAVLRPEAAASLEAMRALAAEMEGLRAVDGMIIQDKWATISVHYHLTRQPEAAKQQILDLLQKSPHIKEMRLMFEKNNIGIVPRVEIDKGTAVTGLIKEHHLQGAIYLGDDVGDVPAFRAIRVARKVQEFMGLAILVTGPETTPATFKEADFTLDSVHETGMLLDWLVDNTKERIKLKTHN